MQEPKDLISMQAALALYDRLISEVPTVEAEFPKIREHYQTLGKLYVS